MTVKDLTIGSPLYRVGLDSIEVARVRLVEQFTDGTRSVVLNTSLKERCNEKEDATEMRSKCSKVWYINIEDAKLAQLMQRSEHVERLKKEMEDSQNRFADAIQRYAFSEPSTPKEI